MTHDLIVVGGGSGGVRAARMAAQRGARVVLIEGGAMGGTCVNAGCIPKKLYMYAAHYATAIAEARGYGWATQPATLDWEVLKRRRRQEIERLNEVYANLLRDAGVEVVRGWARMAGPNTVYVEANGDERFLHARWILIATGGTAATPEFEGAELALASEQVFDMPELPRRMAVVGGGYIASEFASIFNGLGVEVTQIHRGERILRGFDADVALFAQKGSQAAGVELMLRAALKSLVRTEDGQMLRLEDGQTLRVDAVVYAAGRRANTARLGWEALGGAVDTEGRIAVDELQRTSIPSIFAVGDVASDLQLTPVALAQAMAVVHHLFGDGKPQINPWREELVPTAVFMEPCVASVGLTEAQASVRCNRVEIYSSDFRPLRHTLSGSSSRTLVKLVVDGADRRVLGVHVVGDDAAEILQGFAVALNAGATKEQFDSTLGIHPTAAEELCTLRQPVRIVRRQPETATA